MKRGGRETEDGDALAKLMTRVQRNALTQLMPIEALKSRVMHAVSSGQVEESPLITAQSKARRALGKHRESLMVNFSLTPSGAFDIAQEKLGDSEDWDVSAWTAFAEAIERLDNDFFTGEVG